MVEVGRDFWKSSDPNPQPKKGHVQLAAQDHAWTAFKYCPRWRLHSLLGQPVLTLHHAHSKKPNQNKTVFPDFQTKPSVLQFLPTASSPTTGHHWKQPGSVFLAPSLQVFIYIHKPSLLLDKQYRNQKVVLPLIKLRKSQADHIPLYYWCHVIYSNW